MTAGPTYLFGLGATKAGTTWLHRYLAGHPECHLRAIKELHYFDSVEGGSFARQLKVNRAKVEKFTRELATASGARAARLESTLVDLVEWISVLTGPLKDVSRYQGYLVRGAGQARLVGDITPSYAELPTGRLAQMQGLAAETRFVYVLREPVSRLWSHVRMIAARSRVEDHEAETARVFERVLAGEPSEVSRRSDYAGALTRMGQAIAPARLLVLFQEQMHSLPGIERLCAFLGIRPHAADLTARVHEGAALPMTAGQKARARAFLAPQYDFVASALPDMPESWRATQDGVTA